MTQWIAAVFFVLFICDAASADQVVVLDTPLSAASHLITAVGPAQSIVLRGFSTHESLNTASPQRQQPARQSSGTWRQRHPLLFPVLLGAGIGASVGAIFGTATWSDNQKGFHRDDAAILYSSLFGLTGAGVGLVIGVVRR